MYQEKKTDLERKKQILIDLRANKLEGDQKLQELEDMSNKVSKSTSRKGCENLEVRESWSTYIALIEDVEINIEKRITQWTQFNIDISKHHAWFKSYEAIFRNQHLQDTAIKKWMNTKLREKKS